MNNIHFSNSFGFRLISLRSDHHTDNSKGIDRHFLARMRRGTGRIVTDRKEEMLLKPGDVFYLPYGLRYHSYWHCEEEDGRAEWDSFGFTVFPVKSEVSYRMKCLTLGEREQILWEELAACRAVTPYSVGLLYLLLDGLLSQMEADERGGDALLMDEIRRYMEQTTVLRVPELARQCGMSESGLYAFLKRYARMTPVELKNRMRAEEGRELLETTDLSVEEISTKLGFQTAAYFRSIMKRYAHATPQEIRRKRHKL
ncbi:MAG: helix-turn-helix transcriptional regulator [Clostridia bacterium]|nr:helix-turn-helix transcriptional regulator [Clostridia bacterium]